MREFTKSPAGSLPPNGARVTWALINIFKFDDDGLRVEEFVRTDYRTFLGAARRREQVAQCVRQHATPVVPGDHDAASNQKSQATIWAWFPAWTA